MYDIITLGEAVYDTIIKIPSAQILPRDGELLCVNFGEKISVEEVFNEIGGSGVNTAVCFSKLGLKSAFCGPLGKDLAGIEIFKSLQQKKVGTDLISLIPKNSLSFILSHSGERTIFTYHALKNFDDFRPDLTKMKSRWIYVAPLAGHAKNLIKQIQILTINEKIKIAWNPGRSQIKEGVENYREFLPHVDILILNKEEAADFAKENRNSELNIFLDKLSTFGAKIIVITLGSAGAIGFDGEEIFSVPVFPTKCVEATGAGDAFGATFVAAMIFNKGDIFSSLKEAAVNAASVVSKIGAQRGLLSRHEILKLLSEHPEF